MDSLHTTPMLTSRDIRVLHLESTDVCQAACPQCARETDPRFDARQHHRLTVAQLQNLLPVDFVKTLRKIFMCGNYGDPAANHHSLEIYQWFRQHNSDIVLGMNTNGGLQTAAWWQALAKEMHQPLDYVVFGIDGLEDTNHVYRVGVDWHRLMSNVENFIAAGGRAHWDMLVYRHNEHQVAACQQLAKDMGFAWFRAKVTKRDMVPGLEHPIAWQDPKIQSTTVACRALQDQSIYIDSRGRIFPCCWLGELQQEQEQQFDRIQSSWHTENSHPVCQRVCGSRGGVTSFQRQWQLEVQF